VWLRGAKCDHLALGRQKHVLCALLLHHSGVFAHQHRALGSTDFLCVVVCAHITHTGRQRRRRDRVEERTSSTTPIHHLPHSIAGRERAHHRHVSLSPRVPPSRGACVARTHIHGCTTHTWMYITHIHGSHRECTTHTHTHTDVQHTHTHTGHTHTESQLHAHSTKNRQRIAETPQVSAPS
jgi:hypothetical protein